VRFLSFTSECAAVDLGVMVTVDSGIVASAHAPTCAGLVVELSCTGTRHVAIKSLREHATTMKFIRGAISAILLASAFAAALRVRGTGGTPPQHGGWRPLELPDN
jgi:hypothetical protein